MAEDWRSKNLDTVQRLRGQHFIRKPYSAYRPDWDHDHCAVCWVKLMEPNVSGEGIIHEGYAVTADYPHGADYEWICPDCFELGKDQMNWRDVT